MIAVLTSIALAAGPSHASVTVADNEFLRAGRARPVLRLRAGSTVTWRWASQESHQVAVSGPQRFRSAMQSRGRFTRTLRRPGRYRVVCPLHAPGMRMTIVVRR